jgi:hypothetical protein
VDPEWQIAAWMSPLQTDNLFTRNSDLISFRGEIEANCPNLRLRAGCDLQWKEQGEYDQCA